MVNLLSPFVLCRNQNEIFSPDRTGRVRIDGSDGCLIAACGDLDDGVPFFDPDQGVVSAAVAVNALCTTSDTDFGHGDGCSVSVAHISLYCRWIKGKINPGHQYLSASVPGHHCH